VTAGFTAPIEIAPHFRPRPALRHAVLDWDGTVSLLRGGWVEVMSELCLELLPGGDRAAIHAEMLALNGRPSIHQMARIAELTGRGTAEEHQAEYLARIDRMVAERVARAAEDRDAFLVPGGCHFLALLRSRGLALTVVSGTSRPEITAEADLLGVRAFFTEMHGPRDPHDRAFTKRAALQALALEGHALVSFGDGPVEIAEAKAAGALAVAVASDENAPGSRRMDAFKRRQLLDCGADVVIPDFVDAEALLDLLYGA
jgi:phosphoglycolate phosphatase-like HAD superfamily hydrolase